MARLTNAQHLPSKKLKEENKLFIIINHPKFIQQNLYRKIKNMQKKINNVQSIF